MQGSRRQEGIDTVILEMQGMISLVEHLPSCLTIRWPLTSCFEVFHHAVIPKPKLESIRWMDWIPVSLESAQSLIKMVINSHCVLHCIIAPTRAKAVSWDIIRTITRTGAKKRYIHGFWKKRHHQTTPVSGAPQLGQVQKYSWFALHLKVDNLWTGRTSTPTWDKMKSSQFLVMLEENTESPNYLALRQLLLNEKGT